MLVLRRIMAAVLMFGFAVLRGFKGFGIALGYWYAAWQSVAFKCRFR